jgi:RimJ/RimL family protein N-acetyltransferase
MFQLQTPRLILRQFQPSDAANFRAYRNDPEVAKYQSWTPDVSEEKAKAFVLSQSQLTAGARDEWVQIAIEDVSSGELVGDCAVHVDGEGQQAEVGFSIATGWQRKGIAGEALAALLDWAFGAEDGPGLHRVHATIDARNEAAAALLARLGFRREGHFIQNVFFKAAWGDEDQYAMLSSEWLSRAR